MTEEEMFRSLDDEQVSTLLSAVACGQPFCCEYGAEIRAEISSNPDVQAQIELFAYEHMGCRNGEAPPDVWVDSYLERLLNAVEDAQRVIWVEAGGSRPTTEQINSFLPTSLAEAMAFAAALSAEGGIALSNDLRAKPAAVLAMVLTGAELGIPPMHALQGMWVGNDGKVNLHADTMVAVCLARGGAKFFECTCETETSVTYLAMTAAGREISWTWSDRDSDLAGLSTLPHWVAYKRQMRRARCKAALARDAFPDVLAGFYSTEEARDQRALVEQLKEGVAFDVEQAARAVPKSFEPPVEPIPEEV